MSGPAFRSISAGNAYTSVSAGRTFSVSNVAVTALNDTLLMVVASDNAAGTTTLSSPGWTPLFNGQNGQVLTKQAGASEPASYTVTTSAAMSNVNAFIVDSSGGGGVDAVAANQYTTGTSPFVAPASSATSSVDEQYAIYFGSSGVVGFAAPSPAMTVRYHQNGAPGASPALYIADKTLSASGATSAASSTPSGTDIGSAVTILLAQAIAPLAPTAVAPAPSGSADATGIVPFTCDYNSADGANQNAYAFRIKLSSGSYQYWNGTTGALQGTIVWNTVTTAPGAAFGPTLPANVLTNGNTYNWSLASQEAYSSLQGPFAADSTFTTVAGPTCTVTAPTGTVGTSTPAITWTETLGSGSQTAYRAVIETGAYGTTPGSGTPVWDSGVVASAALTVTPPSLINSTTYRVFVQVTQTGGMTSTWSYSTFTVTLTPPATPTVVVTADHDGTTGCPRAAVAITGHDTGSFTYANTTFEVQCSYNGGAWMDVRGASAVAPNSSDQATVYDYETPIGGTQSYRARTAGTAGGMPIIGSWSSVVTVSLPDSTCWLTDPTNPATAVGFPVRSDLTRKRPITQDVTVTLGSSLPVVSSDVRQVEQGTLVWHTSDAADRAALELLLDGGVTLLQRLPAEVADAGPAWYFRPIGDVTIARYADGSPLSDRDMTTAWVGRNRP